MSVYGDFDYSPKPYVEPENKRENNININAYLEEQNKKIHELI